MKKLKTWQIVLLVIFYPIGICYLIYWLIKRGNQCQTTLGNNQNQIKVQGVQSVQVSLSVQENKLPTNYELFDDIINDSALVYKYEQNICVMDNDINASALALGKDIEFKQEPDNQYDNKAIAIYFNNIKVGYVYKGVVQDMINSWIKRGDYFRGYLNKINIEEKKITYKIGFYKDLNNFEGKTVSMVKINKKDEYGSSRSDFLLGCDVGDLVTLEYDYDSETYVVFNDCYEEIGELSKSVSEKFSEKKEEGYNLLGVISENYEDENEKIKATITVYFIKENISAIH